MPEVRRREPPDRNLALELVRVTRGRRDGCWALGRGAATRRAATEPPSMRCVSWSTPVSMRGVVVIGEGEKDNAPMLYNGEEVGNGDGPDCDFAVDPVDGTTLMSKGMPNAISVLAVAERGAMFDPSAVFYMNKIAVGPDAIDVIDITAPIGENLRRVAKAKNSSVPDLTVCILDRPRHHQLIADVRDAGARIRLITDGDVAGAISACRPRIGHRHARRHRRHARGHHHPRPRSVAWAGPIQAQLAPTDDARTAAGDRPRPRPGPGTRYQRSGLR